MSTRNRRWTPEAVAEIHERRMAGDTLDEVGADYGVTRERIRQLLVQHGLDTYIRRKKPPRLKTCGACGSQFVGWAADHHKTDEHFAGLLATYGTDTDGVIRDYQNFVLIKTIQQRYEINGPQLYRILRHARVPKRGKPFDVSLRASVKARLHKAEARYGALSEKAVG